jgi:hypothetical protein
MKPEEHLGHIGWGWFVVIVLAGLLLAGAIVVIVSGERFG